jgi:peptide/nickel transport system substrate-binding protein
MPTLRQCMLAIAAVAAAALGFSESAHAQKTLRAVMHSDLKILDPIWTTAYIVRNHGYMVYDTLFATDEKGEIKPQMVDKHDVSADQLTHTFTLRDGLLWHDGQPVTAEDCVASIKRWAAKDSTGQKLMTFVDSLAVKDSKTFEMKLKSPTGLVLLGLGKPSSNVPFMMPKRVADTDPNTQISDFTGSGPFIFKRDEWKPGDKTVYVKNDKYKPRSEPASGLAGGKVVKVDRVEWRAISDHQQAVNALLAGEIDFIEAPPHDLLPLGLGDPNVTYFSWNPWGNQYTFRPNWLSKPFDNPKVRQALFHAFNQEDFLKAVVGDAKYYKLCHSYFPCGTPLASEKGMEGLLKSDFKKAQELLKEAGYDGTPIRWMSTKEYFYNYNAGVVFKQQLEAVGFKVDLQVMDWATLVKRRSDSKEYDVFVTGHPSYNHPVLQVYLEASWPGWWANEEKDRIVNAIMGEPDPQKTNELVRQLQALQWQDVPCIKCGEAFALRSYRNNLKGYVDPPDMFFWNAWLG